MMNDYNDKMSNIVENARKNSQETLDRFKRESEARMSKMEAHAKNLNKDSVDNFASWRDYLHKYYVLILAFVAGSGIFSSVTQSIDTLVIYGIYLALAGIFIGFSAINIYFYLERKWLQISNYTAMYGLGNMMDHPEIDDDPVLATRLNLAQKINEFNEQLKVALINKDTKRIHHLKNLIKGHKTERYLLKYLGQQFGAIEKFWITSVLISFTLTSAGVLFIFISLLS